jgi:ankyrin repeat protein
MSYLDECEIGYELYYITCQLYHNNISIDDKLKLITQYICEIVTDNGASFLICLLSDFDINIDVCIYKKIISLTPDINRKDNKGMTAIMYAIHNCYNKEILLELLKQKLDLNRKYLNNWSTSMYFFAFCSDKDILLELLKQKPNLIIKDDFNKTALDYAIKYYVCSYEFQFDILEKLYAENYKQDNKLVNSSYIKIRNKYKVFPLILFRHQKRKNINLY